MKIIVGLGNPTDRYAGTRHNMGFGVADELAERHQIRMSLSRHRALCGTGIVSGERMLLVKPLTYMNASGESVRPITDYYKAEVGDVIVIYDDISLDVGQIRVRGKGSAGGHNGMKSVIAHLGSSDFPRVRVGVGAKPPQMDLTDYVLSRFPKEELPVVRESLQTAADAVEMILSDGVERTMNRYNAFTRKSQGEGTPD